MYQMSQPAFKSSSSYSASSSYFSGSSFSSRDSFSSNYSYSSRHLNGQDIVSFNNSKLEYIVQPFQTYISIASDTATPTNYIIPILNHQKMIFSGSFSSSYQLSQRENNYALKKQTEDLIFQPDNFLKVGAGGKFVGQAEEIKEYIEEAYNLLFGKSFPEDIKISLLEENEFKKISPHSSVVGLSINRRQQGLLSEIFVIQGTIGKVLLTVGHELGHVLTSTLDHSLDEEAKAYAFSLQWIDLIKEWNIAGLREAIITETPAENGLHNKAYYFIQRLIKQGKLAWEVYLKIIRKEISLVTENLVTEN
ncbi:hypothetical protein HYU21_00710 [Candidatus Woesearchaeota archaeon]|nr:hypothetical protein [Candidatus Woesearchaeota archaeon]